MATSAADIRDALDATILKLASGLYQTVNFNGQSFTPKNIGTLREERTYWAAQAIRDATTTSGAPARYQIAFVPSRRITPLP